MTSTEVAIDAVDAVDAVGVRGGGTTAGWPLGEVLRDIARGGLAGLIVGTVVGGVGARLVMRLIALVEPDAVGKFTENGFRIGSITLDGTLGLVLFGGLFAGISGAVLWVVLSPWIPGGTVTRAILAMPVAIAITAIGVVQRTNEDFTVLGHDPLVVVLLLAFVAIVGASVALFDSFLEPRLPHPASTGSASTWVYALLTAIGLLLGLTLVIQVYVLSPARNLGYALIVVGVATLLSWGFRLARRPRPVLVDVLGYGAIIGALVVGLGMTWWEVSGALRLG